MTKKILSALLAVLLLAVLLVLLVRPRWYLNLTRRVDVSPATGAALVEKYECRKCHFIKGEGAYYAPNLDKITDSDETLYGWLANPPAMRPNTAMPNLHLSDSEIQAIIAYLKSVP